MSTSLSIAGHATRPVDTGRGHRLRVRLAAGAVAALLLSLAIYGFDYYRLDAGERPLSPKHELLRPSGEIAIKLGLLGAALFLIIFLYAVRKRIAWLRKRGSSRHWLDFHVVAGLAAPVIIAFHASFKFHGIAGMAFWIMLAVALSGVIGRYIYAQIPRSLSSAELSLKELDGMQNELAAELAGQKLLRPADMGPLLRTPSVEQVRDMALYRVFLLIVFLDMVRPIHIARLRTRVLSGSAILLSLGGLLRTRNQELEQVIAAARRKSALSKRIAFLGRTQQVFHLWHVVHRPFSYSFAVLAIIHIVTVVLLGYV